MSQFEFVTVLVSLVVAFGVSELLSGWGRLYLHRAEAPPYALQFVASVLLLVALLQTLWGYWGFRDLEWQFGGFLLVLSPLLPLVVAAHLIVPPTAGAGGPAQPRAHYLAVHRAIFALLAAWVALGTIAELALVEPSFHAGQVVRLAAVTLLLALGFTSNSGLHWAGFVVFALLQAAFIGTVTPALD